MQLVLRVREEFGVEMTFQQIFEAPTVERMALLIETLGEEKQIATIWQTLLGRNHIGPNDNFLDVGGSTDLITALEASIAHELNASVAMDELSRFPTIRQHAQLVRGAAEPICALPPGIVPSKNVRSGSHLFWMHYLHQSLCKSLGEDQSVIFVKLIPDDLEKFGDAPTLPQIADCFLEKILAIQPSGPYTLGGHCLGGVLAYEIAAQLRDSGHEVALLVLVDPPGPSYLKMRHPMTARLTEPRYLLRRLARLGLRMALQAIGEHLLNNISNLFNGQAFKLINASVQRIIETAAASYQPVKYDGKVLLLLASDRAPHVDFCQSGKH
jgi:aryl carrier-like protein